MFFLGNGKFGKDIGGKVVVVRGVIVFIVLIVLSLGYGYLIVIYEEIL